MTGFSKYFLNYFLYVSGTFVVGSWSLVLLENGEVFKLLFLQEFCVHFMSALVRFLCWFLCAGNVLKFSTRLKL